MKITENQLRQLIRETLKESVFLDEQSVIEEGILSGIKEKLLKIARKLINKLPKDLLNSITQEVEAIVGKPASELTMADFNKENINKIKHKASLNESSYIDDTHASYQKKHKIGLIFAYITTAMATGGTFGALLSGMNLTNHDTKMFFISALVMIISILMGSVGNALADKLNQEEDWFINNNFKKMAKEIGGKHIDDIDLDELSEKYKLKTRLFDESWQKLDGNLFTKKVILFYDYYGKEIGKLYISEDGEILKH